MFRSVDGVLHVEGVSVLDLVKELGSPLYVTSRGRLEENMKAYMQAFPDARLLYAVKANNNLSIMKIISRAGFGADVFSDGELYLALLAGFKPEKILFNGNSKSEEEIRMGVRAGTYFSVDSIDELHVLSEVAVEEGEEVKIAFRINPDISPETHPKISTGLRTSKFGIPWEEVANAYRLAVEMPGIVPAGIHCHIGSQILDISPFVEALNRLFDVAEVLEDMGIDVEFLDLGGGLGIDYEGKGSPTPADFAAKILPVFEERKERLNSNPELWLEPGRSIIGNTTILLTKVNAVKKAYKNFVAVDAGFNLLMRPAMYNAYHRVAIANKMDREEEEVYTIVGPICESGDVLAEDRKLPRVERGDIIAIFDAGAYGFSMSSQYNGRRRCAEVLVEGNKYYVIRERESYTDLVGKQVIPEHLLKE
ncbi:diaminopimelate decarboxylase [Archaeoglobus veneficus]|nr:diaminopimelate decarboxylase [Archaeoglobus veneficus]